MQHLHNRQISTNVWQTDGGFKAIGRLHDVKGVPITVHSGREISAGEDLHIMIVTLTLDNELIITDAHYDMQTVPGDDCIHAADAASKLVGLSVAKGFTKGVQKALSRPSHCNHVFALLTAMAPAIMQGYYSAQQDEDTKLDRWENMIDSCFAWRSGGHAAENVLSLIQK